jgi:hypothetical protein
MLGRDILGESNAAFSFNRLQPDRSIRTGAGKHHRDRQMFSVFRERV